MPQQRTATRKNLNELRIEFAPMPVTGAGTVPLYVVTVTSAQDDLDDWDAEEARLHGPTSCVRHYALSQSDADQIAEREKAALLRHHGIAESYAALRQALDRHDTVEQWLDDHGYTVQVRHLCALHLPYTSTETRHG